MPRIREIELEDGSIETALAKSKYNLLPEVFLNDYLVQWILDFDKAPKKDRDEYHGRRDRQPLMGTVIKDLSAHIIQPTLNFYHGILLNLGPQWAMADEGLRYALSVCEKDNLDLSVNEIKLRLSQLGLPFGEEHDDVVSFARGIVSVWENQKHLVTQAWQVWREEVAEIKIAMHKAEESISNLSEHGSLDIFDLFYKFTRPSNLSYYGFSEKRDLALGNSFSLVALIGLLALSKHRPFESHWHFREIERLIYSLRDAEQVRSRTQITVEEFRALEAEYAGTDPFEPYRSDLMPADAKLHRISIHNTHHDRSSSRWLREYQKMLLTLSAWPVPEDFFRDAVDNASTLRWGIITADAEIKKYITDLSSGYHSGVVQVAFERKWVENLARKLFEKKTKRNSQGILIFCEFVRRIASVLSERGNLIVAPKQERIQILISKIKNGNYYIDEW